MTRADHATGTDRVAEVAAQLDRSPDHRQPPGGRARGLRRGARSRRRAARGRPRGPHGHARAPRSATRRPTATRPASRSSARRRGRALYFSRSPIPCHRDGLPDPATAARPVAYLHLGLYAYRRDFLLSIGSLPPSPLEAAEKLEQLRVLEAGYPIAVGIVEEPSIGIDTPEDYRRFVERWQGRRRGRRMTRR